MATADLSAGLRSHLIGDAAIAAIVGARVYAEVLPQNGTLPALTYSRTSINSDEWHLQGAGGISEVSIEINAYSHRYTDTQDLIATIDEAMQGARGAIMGADSIQNVIRENITDLYEMDGDTIIRRGIANYTLFVSTGAYT